MLVPLVQVQASKKRIIIEKIVERLKKDLDAELLSLIVFGSAARGTLKKESDIDILVVIKNKLTLCEQKIKITLRDIKEEMIEVYLINLETMFERLLTSDPFLINIIASGEIIYDVFFLEQLKRLIKKGLFAPNKETGKFLLKKAEEQLLIIDLIFREVASCLYWYVSYTIDAYFNLKGIKLPWDVSERYRIFRESIMPEVAQLHEEVIMECKRLEKRGIDDILRLSKLYEKCRSLVERIKEELPRT